MTERIPAEEITEPEEGDANVLDDDELATAGADAEDGEAVEDDAATSPEPPTEEE